MILILLKAPLILDFREKRNVLNSWGQRMKTPERLAVGLSEELIPTQILKQN